VKGNSAFTTRGTSRRSSSNTTPVTPIRAEMTFIVLYGIPSEAGTFRIRYQSGG